MTPEELLARLRPPDDLDDVLSDADIMDMVRDEFRERIKAAEKAEVERLAKVTPWGDGQGGPFDFSRQGQLLRTTLQAAVPLWIMELSQHRKDDPEDFWRHVHAITQEAGQYLAEHGDALMFKVPGVSAKAFNHLAKGIACMSFCPGGVKAFEDHWQAGVKSDGVPSDTREEESNAQS